MGSIVFPAARALVAWLEKHGGNLDGVRALGRSFLVSYQSEYEHLCMVGAFKDHAFQQNLGADPELWDLQLVRSVPMSFSPMSTSTLACLGDYNYSYSHVHSLTWFNG